MINLEEPLKPSAEMLAMKPEELFGMADTNGDGEVSYVEYATAIYRSPKHGPIGFGKSDRKKSATLNLKEFESRLKGIKWFDGSGSDYLAFVDDFQQRIL